MLIERGFDMAFALAFIAAAAAGCIGWLARSVNKRRSYRETCRLRLREAMA